MKGPFFASIVIWLAVFAVVVNAQQTTPARDTFNVGTQRVVIPPPAGFINGYPRIASLTAHFNAISDPSFVTYAVHVPIDVALKLNSNQPIGSLDFYTNIFVPKSMLDFEVRPKAFAEFAANTEKNAGTAIDLNNPEIRSSINKSLDGLQNLYGRPADVEMKQPKNLGVIDKQDDVFSMMVLTAMETSDGIRRVLGTMSWVVVNKRMIYISVYKRFTTDKDIADLQNFTKTWTAAILAANK